MKPLSVNSLSPRPFRIISHGFTVAALGVPFRAGTFSRETAFLAVRKSPIKAVYAKPRESQAGIASHAVAQTLGHESPSVTIRSYAEPGSADIVPARRAVSTLMPN